MVIIAVYIDRVLVKIGDEYAMRVANNGDLAEWQVRPNKESNETTKADPEKSEELEATYQQHNATIEELYAKAKR